MLPTRAYQLCRLHHGVCVEVGAEEADPEESCLLGDRWQRLLDNIGGLVFALQHSLAMGATR